MNVPTGGCGRGGADAATPVRRRTSVGSQPSTHNGPVRMNSRGVPSLFVLKPGESNWLRPHRSDAGLFDCYEVRRCIVDLRLHAFCTFPDKFQKSVEIYRL